jgi:hypothetical protein
MDVAELLKGLKRSSKSDDPPGTVIGFIDEVCPNCGKRMKKYKPCCGAPNGFKGCSCGYRIELQY